MNQYHLDKPDAVCQGVWFTFRVRLRLVAHAAVLNSQRAAH